MNMKDIKITITNKINPAEREIIKYFDASIHCHNWLLRNRMFGSGQILTGALIPKIDA